MNQILLSIAGIAVILVIAFALSNNRRAIRPRVVGAAFALQAFIAWLVLWTSWGRAGIQGLSNGVANMHERKAKMTDLADAFLALPGGIGTLDELFEAWSWNVLGYHAKPFCLLNVEGFWDGLITFIDHATESGFLSQQRRSQLLVARTPEQALELLDEAAAAATQGMVW